MGRPKKVVAEGDVLSATSLNLKKKNIETLDRIQAQLGMPSRASASTRLLDAVENMLKTGQLTIAMIASESLPKT